MAVTCARCGTQNPDGNRFCTSCGTPLVPTSGPPAATTAVAPPPPPPTYQSPYYAPPPGTGAPIVHRTPWMMIISIVVGAVLIVGAIGTVLALTLGHHSTTASDFSAPSSPSPLASPSPGQTPTPLPSSRPTPSTGGGQRVSNDSETVAVPDGWQVLNKDANSISLQTPDGDGALTIASGQQSPPATAQQLKDEIDKQLTGRYPDTTACPGTKTSSGPLAGVNGIFWTECYTLTSGGQSVAVGEPLWVGTNAGGNVAYVVVLETSQDNLATFIKECAPVLQSGITWKLT